MCRNPTRGATPALSKEIKDKGYDLKRKIQQSCFWDNMITLNSSQLGERALDENSFSQRFLR